MKNRSLYYTISFVEGAAVMATEIIGAKFLAPLFGSSLYVWSSVMAMTLGGLAGGYFFGGRMSQKENTERRLFVTLFFAATFILIMPLIIQALSPLSLNMPLLEGVVLSSCFILIPPVFCMGMVSPLIVQLISDRSGESGKRAGEVYAISTVGGILATFLTGFYLIPNFGLSLPLFIFGGLLLLFSLFYFAKRNEKTFLLIAFFVATSVVMNFFKEDDTKENILYKSEGMLGKLEVMETGWDMDSTKPHEKHRLLLINNIIQTWIESDSSRSYLQYVNQIDRRFEYTKERKHALLLGLGGGAVANVLEKKNFAVTAVELDQRIIEVARSWFGVSEKVKIINDDARHAIERMHTKYDLIVVDLFNGEVTPSHVLSKESITKMQGLLTDTGNIIFNTYGYIQPPAGLGNLSLLKTLKECGLHYKIGMNGSTGQEDYRNLLIVASRIAVAHIENELTEEIQFDKGSVVTDNNPVLEFQNAAAAKRWRYYYIQNFIKKRKSAL
jgi:predicted membrane-bound spermidine synthase